MSVAVLSAAAQPAAPSAAHLWNIDECMNYAARQSPRAVRSQLALRNYGASYTEAILDHLPSISGSVGASAGFGRSINPADNTYTNVANFNNSYSVGANLTLFNGLRLLNNTRIAKINKLRGKEDLQQVVDQVALETMQAYYDLSYAQGAVTLAREQLATSESTLTQSRRMMDLGLKSHDDVAQVEADVAADRFNLVRVENQQRTRELTLKEKMNFPLDSILSIDTTDIRYTAVVNGESDASKVVSNALVIMPEAKISGMNLRIAKINWTTARASLYPNISASGSVGTSYYTNIDGRSLNSLPFTEQFRNNLSQGIGLSMGIPIFNGGSNHLNVVRRRNDYESARQLDIETRRQLAVEVEGAVMDLEGAIAEQEQAARQVKARELAYRTARQKFEEGLLSALDLQTVSNNLLGARSTLLQARLTSLAKRRLVDYYKGTPLVN